MAFNAILRRVRARLEGGLGIYIGDVVASDASGGHDVSSQDRKRGPCEVFDLQEAAEAGMTTVLVPRTYASLPVYTVSVFGSAISGKCH